MPAREDALQEIDAVLARMGASRESPTLGPQAVFNATGQFEGTNPRPSPATMMTSLLACIERNSPRPIYVESARLLAHSRNGDFALADENINKVIGVLIGVRQDIEAGHIRTLEDRVRDGLSDDLLETASSIAKLNPGAAVVLAVSVLEEHVRKLAAAREIATRKRDDGHRSFEDMTADLLNADVFSSSEKRLMGGWYAQRTSAAHGRFEEVVDNAVPGIIEGVRTMLVNHPT